MVRPERFELPTAWFVARYSIQLSYGRIYITLLPLPAEAKLPQVVSTLSVLPAGALGTRADHFAWMKSPEAVVKALFHSFE